MNAPVEITAPWLKEAPTAAGEYEFRCGETDGKPERITIYPRNGFLMLECPHTGTHVVSSFHNGLTSTEWRLISLAKPRRAKPVGVASAPAGQHCGHVR